MVDKTEYWEEQQDFWNESSDRAHATAFYIQHHAKVHIITQSRDPPLAFQARSTLYPSHSAKTDNP